MKGVGRMDKVCKEIIKMNVAILGGTLVVFCLLLKLDKELG